MIRAINVSRAYDKRVQFRDVNIKFTRGRCYGLIGINGAGKSAFLKILAGDIESDSWIVSVRARKRIAVLRQGHFACDVTEVCSGIDVLIPVVRYRFDSFIISLSIFREIMTVGRVLRRWKVNPYVGSATFDSFVAPNKTER